MLPEVSRKLYQAGPKRQVSYIILFPARFLILRFRCAGIYRPRHPERTVRYGPKEKRKPPRKLNHRGLRGAPATIRAKGLSWK